MKQQCKRGHELVGDNLYLSPKGVRQCKMCRTQYEQDHPRNREKRAQQTRRWKENNPEQHQISAKRSILKRKYHTTPEAQAAKAESQNNRCAICQRLMDVPCIDHDHSCCSGTGSCGKCLRDLLCRSCNVGLGQFQDDTSILNAAIEYLIRWRGRHEQS